MTIPFDPHDLNIQGLIRSLIAQGVTPEAAAKAIEKYWAEHGEEYVKQVQEVMKRQVQHGGSIGIALQPGTPADEPVTVDDPFSMKRWGTTREFILPEGDNRYVRILDPVVDEAYMSRWGYFNHPRANQIGRIVQIDTHYGITGNSVAQTYHVRFDDGGVDKFGEYEYQRLPDYQPPAKE